MRKKRLGILGTAVVALGIVAAVTGTKSSVTSAASYVQVYSKSYPVWGNLYFTNNLSSLINPYKHTYKVTDTQKKNGNTYYELDNGSFVGYINAKAVKHVSNMHGNWVGLNRYVRITNNNDTVWSSKWDANFSTYDRGMSHTFQAKGIYYAANGHDYYSLYNGNKWFGYLNVNSTQTVDSAEGIGLPQYYTYVKITGSKATIWNSFKWNKVRHYSKNYMNHTYEVKRLYYHSNGSTYYSLYNGNNWFGYINANSVKKIKNSWGDIIVPPTMFVKIKSAKQNVWGNFNWTQKRHVTTGYVNHTYQVKGIY